MNPFSFNTQWKKYFLLVFAVILFQGTPVAADQADEELQILRMYYREKDLVVTPTRNPKSISQVAENISVVTSEEIEAMNAHTVAEVLNRVTGVFVNFNQDFGAASLLFIQGSEARHVLVMVDGVPWNFLSEGSAETNSIPVGIIDRIEIIKGPASSAWGSALGGVVNIITKSVGDTLRPTGSISVSYGKSSSQDYRAGVAGSAGRLGYYLFTGYQESEGLRDSREFENPSLYSKFNVSVSDKVDLGLTVGYSQPELKLGDFPNQDITSEADIRTFFSTASLNAALSDEFSLNASVYTFQQKSVQDNEALGLGLNGQAGDLFQETTFDEQTMGGNGKLVWRKGIHTVVLGADFAHGDLDQTLDAGLTLQSIGVPVTSESHPDIDRWALFANDTIVINKWSITPGMRYDYNDITGSFVSPSLGVTYSLGENTIFRASVARGFTVPPLGFTSGGGLFLEPNSDLDPEEVWSYQLGFETAAVRYLWLKATLFRHDLNNRLTREFFGAGPPTFNDIFINSGSIKRQGFEIDSETASFYNFSFRGGFTFVNLDPSNESGSDEVYEYNLALRYDDRKSFRAQLLGHFIRWDLDPVFNASDDDIIWELNINYKIQAAENTTAELFFTGHNLFNGDQFTFGENQNPQRWAEAGLRVKF